MSGPLIRLADLSNPADCELLTRLTDAYARDAMGGGQGLSAASLQKLPQALASHGGLFALIAEQDGEPLGHALCVLGFSSFAAAPLCNLHDVSVLPAARGKGIGRLLLQAVAAEAQQRGCAKLTLEVREDNAVGLALYRQQGFAQSGLGGTSYLMMEKPLA